MKTLLAILLLSLPVAAQAQIASVVVTGPVIKGKIATATITTPTDDLLEGLSAPGGVAMIHTIVRHKMLRTAVPFKAGKPRRLSAFGYHLMLMRTFPGGSTLPMTLIFKNAGAVKVAFRVVG